MRLFTLILLLLLQVTASSVMANTEFSESMAFLRTQMEGKRLVLLGEKHGTQEIPRFVGELVALESEARPVLLALEVDRAEQAAFDRYLRSSGDAASWSRLRAGEFWQVDDERNDGRRNLDVLALIERARLLRDQGRDVSLLAFDVDPSFWEGDSGSRDQAMAESLRAAFVANPDALVLVVTGNVHAMLDRPDYAPFEMQQPMGSHLRDLDPLSVNITARGGEFWACVARECGVRAEFPSATPSQRLDGDVFHVKLVLPQFSVARLH